MSKQAEIVEKSLEVFAADRTGLPDFALHSGGGRIIPHLTSKTYHEPVSFFGTLLSRSLLSEPPVAVIESRMDRGKCWPMEGTQGQVGVRLATSITPTSFSVEHISKLVATDLLSAPRELEVYGFEDTYQQTEPVLLAKFTYNITDKPLQTFPAIVSLFF